MEYYEFRYKTKFSKFVGNFFSAFINILYPLLFLFIIGLINGFDYGSNWALPLLVFTCIVGGSVYAIRYYTSLKGVFLFDSHLKIDRHTITFRRRKRNIFIQYSDIFKCESKEKYGLIGPRELRTFLVRGGDKSKYVLITTNRNKKYTFSVENQDEFVKEVNERMPEF